MGYGSWILDLTRWYQIVFWSGCTTLCFGQQFVKLYILCLAMCKSSNGSISSATLVIISLLNICQSNGMKWCNIVVLICISLIVDEFSFHVYKPLFSFCEILGIFFTHFLLGWLLKLIYCNFDPILIICTVNIFCDLFFNSWCFCFGEQKFLILM